MVVPGHGPWPTGRPLADYVDMLTQIRDRMSALIASGATLEQVAAARPTSEWDERKGDPESFLELPTEPDARASGARPPRGTIRPPGRAPLDSLPFGALARGAMIFAPASPVSIRTNKSKPMSVVRPTLAAPRAGSICLAACAAALAAVPAAAQVARLKPAEPAVEVVDPSERISGNATAGVRARAGGRQDRQRPAVGVSVRARAGGAQAADQQHRRPLLRRGRVRDRRREQPGLGRARLELARVQVPREQLQGADERDRGAAQRRATAPASIRCAGARRTARRRRPNRRRTRTRCAST